MHTLKKRADFQRVQKGRKWVTASFILYGASRERTTDGEMGPRFGFTVSSKAVAEEREGTRRRGTAVDRNRARRRLKEAVRRLPPPVFDQDFDYVIVGRKKALRIKFTELLADLQFAIHKVHQIERGKPRT